MVTLGVDPSVVCMGYAILDDGPVILESGAIKLSKKDHIQTRLGEIFSFFGNIILKYNVSMISIETPFIAKNPMVYLKLGYVRGILYVLAQRNGCIVREYSPCEIKKAITGVGSASKEDVAFALCKIFPSLRNAVKIGLRSDITDAIAVGVTGIWKK